MGAGLASYVRWDVLSENRGGFVGADTRPSFTYPMGIGATTADIDFILIETVVGRGHDHHAISININGIRLGGGGVEIAFKIRTDDGEWPKAPI